MSNSRIDQIKRELLESGKHYRADVLHALAVRKYIQEVVYHQSFQWIM